MTRASTAEASTLGAGILAAAAAGWYPNVREAANAMTGTERSFEPNELQRALQLLLDLDRQIKTGETSPEISLELTIVQLCSRLASVA